MFYYIPVWAFPLQPTQDPQPLPFLQSTPSCDIVRSSGGDDLISLEYYSQISKTYLKIFREELEQLMQKKVKKVWTEQENQLLLNIQSENVDWVSISQLIPNTNSEICQRRHNKITQSNKKWPAAIDNEIKRLYAEKRARWSMIASIINAKFDHGTHYTGKMIKERYEFYLREGISYHQWRVDEDLRLVELVHSHGKSWKTMTPNFPGRTELQLKNRYNGTLKLVEKRVILKLKQSGIKNV